MEILGNRQNVVTNISRGLVNNIKVEIPRSIVKVGNTIGLVVRVSNKICWVGEHNISQDGVETVALTEMTNSTGGDVNVLKYKIENNVLSFSYVTSEGADENVDAKVAVIYHRNFG